jgi:hypothetical protein
MGMACRTAKTPGTQRWRDGKNFYEISRAPLSSLWRYVAGLNNLCVTEARSNRKKNLPPMSADPR